MWGMHWVCGINPIKLDCEDHGTTINVINSLSNRNFLKGDKGELKKSKNHNFQIYPTVVLTNSHHVVHHYFYLFIYLFIYFYIQYFVSYNYLHTIPHPHTSNFGKDKYNLFSSEIFFFLRFHIDVRTYSMYFSFLFRFMSLIMFKVPL